MREKKGRDLTQAYEKSPYTNRMSKGQRDNTNTSLKTFDYTVIASNSYVPDRDLELTIKVDVTHFALLLLYVVNEASTFAAFIIVPMGTNCAPLLADIFLYSYEAEFIQSLLSTGRKRLTSQFNFTYRYIDDVLSINNIDFENYLDQMYPPELEIKDTTESNTSASYLDLLLSIGRDGQLHTSLYDKRDEFNFHITNFPFLNSNIPSSPAYVIFISQLIR